MRLLGTMLGILVTRGGWSCQHRRCRLERAVDSERLCVEHSRRSRALGVSGRPPTI
jgi:hypothetical protein